MHRLLLALLIPLLACAAPADARLRVLGSSLEAPANQIEAHQADSAFWPQRIRGGRQFRAPAGGQVLAIKLKGSALRSSQAGAPDPLNQVHFQTLRPLPDGSMHIVLTSQPFSVPIGGPRNRVTTFRPENLCLPKGGVLAFNDQGGWNPPWYQNGVPFRVFSRAAGSRTARHTADNGTNNGDALRGTVRRNSELLMQFVLGTGRHLGGACRNFLRG
jgi:hypothetical protein